MREYDGAEEARAVLSTLGRWYGEVEAFDVFKEVISEGSCILGILAFRVGRI